MKAATFGASSRRPGSGALLVGGLAAILASTCCLGPLVLVALGVSGAWIANLTKLEPAQACQPGEVCAMPQTRRVNKIVFGIVSVLVLIALVYPYVVKFFY